MKSLLIVPLLLLAAALFLACQDEGGGGTPTAVPDVCQPNPDPATPDLQVIDAPLPGSAVTSPVTVRGRIAAFEAAFKITTYDGAGTPIADVSGMAQEGQTLSPFSEDVAFSVSGPTPACIWVYEASARDGSPIHVGQIPVLLQPPGLKPADSELPAAGICAEPPPGGVVTFTIEVAVPSPRCARVLPRHRVRIENRTGETKRVQLARFDVTLAPGAAETFDAPVGTYLAPGVHSVKVSPPPFGGPELWLMGD